MKLNLAFVGKALALVLAVFLLSNCNDPSDIAISFEGAVQLENGAPLEGGQGTLYVQVFNDQGEFHILPVPVETNRYGSFVKTIHLSEYRQFQTSHEEKVINPISFVPTEILSWITFDNLSGKYETIEGEASNYSDLNHLSFDLIPKFLGRPNSMGGKFLVVYSSINIGVLQPNNERVIRRTLEKPSLNLSPIQPSPREVDGPADCTSNQDCTEVGHGQH